MTELRLKYDEFSDYKDDIALLRKALNANGYDARDSDIQAAWKEHSENSCASWLIVYPESQYNFESLIRHFEPV